MPRPRFDNLPPEKRQKVLRGAAAEFSAHGFERASLNRILAATDISKGAFYYYFDDKSDLFATVMLSTLRELEQAVASLGLDLGSLEGATFWSQIREWSDIAMPLISERPQLVGLAKMIYEPPPVEGFSETVAEQLDRIYSWLARVIERGRELGAVRVDLPIELQLEIVLGAGQGSDRWFVEHWSELADQERARLIDVVYDCFERLLTSSTDSTSGGDPDSSVAKQ